MLSEVTEEIVDTCIPKDKSINEIKLEKPTLITQEKNTEPSVNNMSFFDEFTKITNEYSDEDKEIIPMLQYLLKKVKNVSSEDKVLFDLIMEINNKIETVKCLQESKEAAEKIIKESQEQVQEISTQSTNLQSVANTSNITNKFATYNKYVDDDEENEYPRMSKKFFNKLLCSDHRNYYRTHELNDILYLHFKGFRKLENLDTFTGLKAVYLEGNCIKKIEGFSKCKKLLSLYLHENMIEKIENLEELTQLANLNLSDNCIQVIENLGPLQNLQNCLLKRNRIGYGGINDLKGLYELHESCR